MVTNEAPFRSELFSIDLLQHHARLLAKRHEVAVRKGPNRLLARLSSNERLLRAYNERTLLVEKNRRITPASEWLLDNFYLIEAQIRMARRHLPRGFSRELPHLISGPNTGFPRVYDLALELIAHVDGRIDAAHLTSFVAAYEEVTALNLGELWAIPIMLRLGLIENLRRVAAQLMSARQERDDADEWANQMLRAADADPARLVVVVAALAESGVKHSPAFVTEFWGRMQQKSPALKLALSWMEERLAEEGTSIEQLVQAESQSQAANQVSVGNSISSMRFLDAMNWREFVETLSLVERQLRTDPADVYNDMDFATRDAYRHVVEKVARQSPMTETDVARLVVELAGRYAGLDRRRSHVGYYLVDGGRSELDLAARVKISLAAWLTRLSGKVPLAFYLASIATITAGFVWLFVQIALWHEPAVWVPALVAVVGAIGASQLAVAIVNWLATLLVRPRLLPRLDFSDGIPM
ncbi:MAG TPA: cyclic beta 1-2 glucan synthetase, partial [Verrucomicrobiae bacterium]|nr:cyclic beta 1-2 glucan synthetase [Verrucomicrobiae bacterium]